MSHFTFYDASAVVHIEARNDTKLIHSIFLFLELFYILFLQNLKNGISNVGFISHEDDVVRLLHHS